MKQNSVKKDLLLFEQKLVNSGEMDQSWISVHEKHGPMSPTICQWPHETLEGKRWLPHNFRKEMHQIEREILAEWYAYFDIIS